MAVRKEIHHQDTPTIRHKYYKWYGLGLFLFLLIGSYAFFSGPPKAYGKRLVVARAESPGWPEMEVVQQHDPGPLSFYSSTLFVKSEAENAWYGYYLEHEASYWWLGRIEFDSQNRRAIIRKNGSSIAELFPDKQIVISRRDGASRAPHIKILGEPKDTRATTVHLR